MLALLVRLFIELIQKLAVIGDLAHRRISRGGNLHKIQPTFPRHTDGLERLHHAQLAAIIIHYAYFARADTVIYSRAFSGSKTPFGDKLTSEMLGASFTTLL